MDRTRILRGDETYTKSRYNEREVIKYTLFQKYGYLTYNSIYDSEVYKNASEDDKFYVQKQVRTSTTVAQLEENAIAKEIIYRNNLAGYQTVFLPTVYNDKGVILSPAQCLFVLEANTWQRLGNFFANLFRIETIWDVQDPNLTDRYIRLEWDFRSNMPAIVGSGTNHKYLLYFDDKFPFVHQNFFHINLGTSFLMSNGDDVVQYMKEYIGDPVSREQIFPKDVDDPTAKPRLTTYDFHTVTYSKITDTDTAKIYFPEGEHYIVMKQYKGSVSRIGISFIIGIISIFAAYILGLPIGIWMAQRKDKLVDIIGNIYIIFIMAVPSLAYIYMFATLGKNLFGLPTNYALADNKVLAFVLPTISLALPSIAGLMKWMRRYMIDQQNSDYVKFARSQGLSEGEIFSRHISRNAFIFLVHGVPANILAALVGAIITERVYAIPGVGGMLTDSINRSDNAVIVGVTVFYTVLTIVGLIAGDLLLAKYDPRISLTNDRS